MKVLLSLVAMGWVMAAVAVLVVVDLVLRYWPVLVAAAIVIAVLRWWTRHRATALTEQAGAPAYPASTPVAPAFAPRPLPLATVDTPLVIGDESGIRPPAAAGALAWGVPSAELAAIDDRMAIAHREQVRR